MNITFELQNKTELKIFLDKAKNIFTDFTVPLKQVESMQNKETKNNFASSGGNFGGWKPRKKNYPWAILNKSGKMKSAFNTQKLTKNTLEIGNKTKYYPYHQLGTAKLPQRQMLGWTDKMIESTEKIFEKYIENKLK